MSPEPARTSTTSVGETRSGGKEMTAVNLKEYEHVYSYELGIDIKTGEDAWQAIRFASQIDPQVEPVEFDGATYDDLGGDHPVRTSEKPTLNFYVQSHRGKDGSELPEVKLLRAATEPDATGSKGTVTVRYYDKPAGERKANPDEAYEMDATVSMTRAENGNGGLAGWNVTLKGLGKRRKIKNPAIS